MSFRSPGNFLASQDAPESQSEVADNREKTFSNGDFYVGGWRDGVRANPCLPGIFLSRDENVHSDSPYAQPEVEGLYTWADGSHYEGTWQVRAHCLVLGPCMLHARCFEPCAELVPSHMQEGRKHGVGKQVWASGASYQGEGPCRLRRSALLGWLVMRSCTHAHPRPTPCRRVERRPHARRRHI